MNSIAISSEANTSLIALQSTLYFEYEGNNETALERLFSNERTKPYISDVSPTGIASKRWRRESNWAYFFCNSFRISHSF